MIQYKRSNSVNDSSIIGDLTEIPALKAPTAASNGDSLLLIFFLVSTAARFAGRGSSRPQSRAGSAASNLAVEGESWKFSSPERHCPGPAPPQSPSWTSSSSHETLEDDSNVSIVLPFQTTQPIQTPEKGAERDARE